MKQRNKVARARGIRSESRAVGADSRPERVASAANKYRLALVSPAFPLCFGCTGVEGGEWGIGGGQNAERGVDSGGGARRTARICSQYSASSSGAFANLNVCASAARADAREFCASGKQRARAGSAISDAGCARSRGLAPRSDCGKLRGQGVGSGVVKAAGVEKGRRGVKKEVGPWVEGEATRQQLGSNPRQ